LVLKRLRSSMGASALATGFSAYRWGVFFWGERIGVALLANILACSGKL